METALHSFGDLDDETHTHTHSLAVTVIHSFHSESFAWNRFSAINVTHVITLQDILVYLKQKLENMFALKIQHLSYSFCS